MKRPHRLYIPCFLYSICSMRLLKLFFVKLFGAENFRIVDIEIIAYNSLFATLQTNLFFRLISKDKMLSLTFKNPVLICPPLRCHINWTNDRLK